MSQNFGVAQKTSDFGKIFLCLNNLYSIKNRVKGFKRNHYSLSIFSTKKEQKKNKVNNYPCTHHERKQTKKS